MQFVKELRKTPVLVNNSVGFLVNRIFIPYFIEAFQLLEEGAPPRAIDSETRPILEATAAGKPPAVWG